MGNFQGYRTEIKNNYEKFREEINANYAKFLRGEWVETPAREKRKMPIGNVTPVKPVILDTPDPEIEDPVVQAAPLRDIERRKHIREIDPTAPVLGDLTINPLDTAASVSPVEIRQGERRKRVNYQDPTRPDLGGIEGNLAVNATPIVVSPNPLPRAKVKTVEIPKPKQQPMPVVEVQIDSPKPTSHMYATVYGTQLALSEPDMLGVRLADNSNKSIADTWEKLADGRLDRTLKECLDLRQSHSFNDWAYLNFLGSVAQSLAPRDADLQTVIQSYLYTNSGYKMRLGRAEGKLVLLYASEHQIYDTPYIYVDNTSYYPLNSKAASYEFCDAAFPNESSLSLLLTSTPRLASKVSEPRQLHSRKGIDAETQVNENLLKFYEGYPSSAVNNDMMSRWMMYCNTPLCEEVRETLYPTLSAELDGRGLYGQVNRLLNFVQTAFKYEYDDVVWGHDRPFFPDESVYYPACDCEDRTALFTRLVRDLVGLDCAIVYYPGHLAAAVAFPASEQIQGDFISVDGRDFLICDPTFIGANAGRTMTGMDNNQATAAVLR